MKRWGNRRANKGVSSFKVNESNVGLTKSKKKSGQTFENATDSAENRKENQVPECADPTLDTVAKSLLNNEGGGMQQAPQANVGLSRPPLPPNPNLTLSSPAAEPKEAQKQPDIEMNDDENKPDEAAVMLADAIPLGSRVSSIRQSFQNINQFVRSITAESSIDLGRIKGRYNVEGDEDEDEGKSVKLSRREKSVGSRSFKLKFDDDDCTASRVTANIDDKYMLMVDEEKSGSDSLAGAKLFVEKNKEKTIELSSYRYGANGEDGTLTTVESFDKNTNRHSRKRHRRRDDDEYTWRSFSYSLDGLTLIGDDDLFEVKQKFGLCAIAISVIQLLIIAIMMSLCGVAPLEVNPMVGPYPDVLSYWGGKNAFLITRQMQVWRLATPILLHAGVIHLFCNVAIQLETGAFFEREWGSSTWFLIYIFSALGSSIVSCVSQPDTVSVGASGALMGLFGAKLGEVCLFSCFRAKTGSIRNGVRMEQLSGVLCSVAIVSLFSFIPYVDWAGHMGGLVVGFLIGGLLFSMDIEIFWKRVLLGIFFFALLSSLIGYAVYYLFTEMDFNADMKDACNFYRQIFREGYDCSCQKLFAIFEEDDDYYND